MRKEPLAFLIVAVLLALFVMSGGEGERTRGRGRGIASLQIPEMKHAKMISLGEDILVWSLAGRSIYRAPSDVEGLPPIAIAAPPIPARPHPGLPTIPDLRGPARASLRHELEPNSNLKVVAADESTTVAEPAVESNAEGAEGEDELGEDPLDQVTDYQALSIVERERLSIEERARVQRLQEEREKTLDERRRGLDRVVYGGGGRSAIVFGRLEVAEPGKSIHQIKVDIDRIQAQENLTEAARRRALDAITFVFFEDRGAKETPRRVLVKAGQVQTIEFAKTALNTFRLGVLAESKQSFEAQFLLCRDAFRAGEVEAAVEQLAKLHAKGEGTAASHRLLSDGYRKLLRYDQELATLERGLKSWPRDFGLQSRMGKIALRLNLPARAEEALQRVLTEDPEFALARLGMAQVCYRRGEVDKALAHLERIVKPGVLEPDDRRDANLLHGRIWLEQGEVSRAGQSFSSVTNDFPGDAEAIVGQSTVALATQGAEAALALIGPALAEHPLHGGLVYMQAVALLRQEKWSEALSLLDKVPELDPLLTARARVARSYIFEKTHDFESALTEAESALVAEPGFLAALQQRARCLQAVGNLTEAREVYDAVLAEDPSNVDVIVALGDVASELGEIEVAQRFYDRAAKLEKDYPELFGRRFITSIRARDKAVDNEFVAKISAAMERNAYLQMGLAYYYYAMENNPQDTLQRFRQVLARENGTAPILAYAAQTRDAIEDNLSKVRWTDDFERTGTKIMRDWEREVGSGVNIALAGGRLLFKGEQRRVSMQPTVVLQKRNGKEWHRFEMDLDMQPTVGAYMGFGILSFRRTQPPAPYEGLQRKEDGSTPWSGAQVALAPEGKLRMRYLDKGEMSEWEDLNVLYSGGPVRLGIEIDNRKEHSFWLLVNRTRAQKIIIPGLGRANRTIEMQAFCQADSGREVKAFTVDNVEIVTRKL